MTPAAIRHLLRLSPTIAPVPNRALLYVSGPHASEFLNGLLSSAVSHPPKGSFFSSFLQAQGRIVCETFVYPKQNSKGQDGFILEYDKRLDNTQSLKEFLQRFVLRSKVRLQDVTDEYDVWSIWGSESEKNWETPRSWTFARSGVIEPVWSAEESWPWGTDPLCLRDRRAVGMGLRRLVTKSAEPGEASTHDKVDSDTYTLHRILLGIPEGIEDMPSLQSFPMESNLDIMGALDFRKGCYVGQELTVRTYHTGVLRKRILPVAIETDSTTALPPPQTDIRAVQNESAETRTRTRGTGKILTTAQGVGLALMRLEQVEAVEKGLMNFEVEYADEKETKIRQRVSHWWPEWWPKPE